MSLSSLARPCLLACLLLVPARAPAEALELPEGLPETFSVVVTGPEGRPQALELRRRSLRAEDFRVRVWSAAEGDREVAAPPSRTYQGVVAGDPDSVVGASLGPEGLTAMVFPSAGTPWSVEPAGDGGHRVVDEPLLEAPDAGGVELPPGARELPAAPPAARPKSHPCTLKLAEIAFDVDNPYFVNMGSDLAATIANVEAHLAAVDAHYARDVQITYELTEIIVRESPFYSPTPDENLLVQFRNEWRANQAAVRRDIAHLMTGQPAPGLAGLAYVAVACSQDWAYGWSVNSSGVVSHEIGHNWSSGHCHDTAPCNNMCGACLWIGPNTKEIIRGFAESRGCLDDVAGFAAPLPPYATPDRVEVLRDELVDRVEILVDPLANDHDGNCDELELAAFDSATALGGQVRRAPGLGEHGHDALWYLPPCSVFVGEDRFAYSVRDASGEVSDGEVRADLRDENLLAWWPFEDGGGDTASEWTRGRDALLNGSPSWIAGPSGGAIELDGVDDAGVLQPLGLERAEATFSAWIRPEGLQVPFAGLVFTRESGSTAGLNFGDAGELRYHWEGGNWGWDSGLVPPQGAWSFVALVIEPERATIWLDDGSGLVASVHEVPHGLQTWAGSAALGEDPAGGRLFRGALDELRVHDTALDRAALEALVAEGGGNVAPSPADGSATAEASPVLSWVAPLDAEEHDVYFGADYASVRDAGPATAGVYRGRQALPSWEVPELLMPGRTYAWRADAVRAGVPVRGPVWIFRSDSASPRLHAHWPLDDDALSAADAAGGGLDGTLTNGPAWSTGRFGGALSFDGADDFVDLPELALPDLPVTITTWIRRDGAQSPWSGLLFSRGGGAAGFNFGEADELRYHWGNGAASYGWDSGLVVPDATWVLAALVVEPNRATIWLHDGTLVSAVNGARHDPRRFEGTVRIGQDPNGGPRFFRGELDDVRVWAGALGADELEALWLAGGPATNPEPADGAVLDAPAPRLAWTPRPDAGSHELYFGTDLAGVRAAGPGDPEHAGSLTEAEWSPAPELLPGQVLYWRVDEVVGAETVSGPIWRFAAVERIGDSLRVRKAAGGEPELRWTDFGNGREYEVRRCLPAPGEACVPAAEALVGPGRGDWTDPAAGGVALAWYRVVETGPCAP